MRKRNSSLKAQSRWLVPVALSALAGSLLGCPNQELAPLGPCTVSGVSLEIPQSGVDKVDLLFMIDNSGSMAEEQKKLAAVLPSLVQVLTTGFKVPPTMMDQKPDFPPVKSLHIGVISSDMGVNLAPAAPSCGALSYDPAAPDPGNLMAQMTPPSNATRLRDKVFGDDGLMNISTAVAVAGIFSRPAGTNFSTPVTPFVQADPTCGGLALSPNQRFIDFTAGTSNAAQIATQFGCIAKLGRNGCGLEQQLESMLKAVTPSTSTITFSRNSKGHGDNANRLFLREDAVLAVVLVSDEEDCSIPDESSELFNTTSASVFKENINIRCGLEMYQSKLHPVGRFVDGLKALKPPAYIDRIIFAGIVGIPLNPQKKTFSGADELTGILGNPDMVFRTRVQAGSTTGDLEPVPACISPKGDGTASPARRMVEVAKGFGKNGIVTSICEDSYNQALDVIIQKIADQLTGACLPRKLTPNVQGNVECDVVEIFVGQSSCDPAKGRVEKLPDRNGRTVCRIGQVPVLDDKLGAGTGWYYDDFTTEVKNECKTNPQRIAFTAGAEPANGSQTKFECFQPVSSADDKSTGLDAVNLACDPVTMGDSQCTSRDPRLFCTVAKTCQVSCGNASDCPESWLCEGLSGPEGNQKTFCINPTCPQSATAVE